MALKGEILVAAAPPNREVEGDVLALTAPISFWGGVDPATGRIIAARHPERGANVGGRVLVLPGTIGSSSASSVLLELTRNGHAPAAILMPEPDAILLIGLLVAREMGWRSPPALRLPAATLATLAHGKAVIAGDGTIRLR